MATMWCGVGRCSDCSTDARPDVHWSPAEASAAVAWHRHWSLAKKQLMTPIGKATPKVKNELSSDDDNLQKQFRAVVKQTPSGETARTGRQGCEGQRRRGQVEAGVATFMKLAQLAFANAHTASETPKRVAYVFSIAVLLYKGSGGRKVCQRVDRHSSFPSQL